MKKIEKIMIYEYKDVDGSIRRFGKVGDLVEAEKINELVDVVNNLYEYFGGFSEPEPKSYMPKAEKEPMTGTHASICECEHCKPVQEKCEGIDPSGMNCSYEPKKDELAELMMPFADDEFEAKDIATMSRKWAVEVVEKWHKGDCEIGLGVKNLLERLRGL